MYTQKGGHYVYYSNHRNRNELHRLVRKLLEWCYWYLEYIKEHDKEEELLYLIKELDIHDMTEINDFLWFDDEYIYESLGITEEDEEEE